MAGLWTEEMQLKARITRHTTEIKRLRQKCDEAVNDKRRLIAQLEKELEELEQR